MKITAANIVSVRMTAGDTIGTEEEGKKDPSSGNIEAEPMLRAGLPD